MALASTLKMQNIFQWGERDKTSGDHFISKKIARGQTRGSVGQVGNLA